MSLFSSFLGFLFNKPWCIVSQWWISCFTPIKNIIPRLWMVASSCNNSRGNGISSYSNNNTVYLGYRHSEEKESYKSSITFTAPGKAPIFYSTTATRFMVWLLSANQFEASTSPWQLKEIRLSFVPVGGNLNLVWVGWGIWTGSVKSFQPNKRVLAEEFKDRATTLRGETKKKETKRNSYIPFNSLVHIVLFLSLSVRISMKGCLRSSLAWRVFVSQNLMYYIFVMNYMFSPPNKKRFHLG